MTYGDKNWQPWVLDQEEAFPILKHAYDAGINTFDVADTYSNGRSEEILGAFLKEYKIPRNKVVIMTKVFHYVNPARGAVDAAGQGRNDDVQVNQVGLSRKHIFDAVDASIARLGTYIDVLQTHRLDREVSLEEAMKALNDVIESGKARYIGASSVSHPHPVSNHHQGTNSILKDGSLGVPDGTEHSRKAQLAQIYFNARLLQPPLP